MSIGCDADALPASASLQWFRRIQMQWQSRSHLKHRLAFSSLWVYLAWEVPSHAAVIALFVPKAADAMLLLAGDPAGWRTVTSRHVADWNVADN